MKTMYMYFFIFAVSSNLIAQTIDLPPAQKSGGMPLMEALSKRASVRSFDTTAIPLQQLSDLLWASFGVNRPDGKRTAPSANNKQEIDLYVLLKTGAYLYDARAHALVLVTSEDLRATASEARFAEAPVQLIYVADLARRGSSDDGAMRMANMDCGYISQNTYLYCASVGMVTGARGTVNRDALAPKLKLKPEQRILLAHSIGQPKP